jgi:hypothetical protein
MKWINSLDVPGKLEADGNRGEIAEQKTFQPESFGAIDCNQN